MEMDNMSQFSASQFAESVAAAANVSLEDVTILEITFEIATTYKFDADINESDAKTAVATANGVSVDNVSVELTRMQSTQARRLSTTHVKAIIKTGDASKVDEIASSAANATALQETLASMGKVVPITVHISPTKAVRVITGVECKACFTAVAPPSPAALTSQIKTIMGVDVVATTVDTTTTPTPTPAPFVPSPVPSPSPSPAPVPTPTLAPSVGIPKRKADDSHSVRVHEGFTFCSLAIVLAAIELR